MFSGVGRKDTGTEHGGAVTEGRAWAEETKFPGALPALEARGARKGLKRGKAEN
jgi:hypothetical protein